MSKCDHPHCAYAAWTQHHRRRCLTFRGTWGVTGFDELYKGVTSSGKIRKTILCCSDESSPVGVATNEVEQTRQNSWKRRPAAVGKRLSRECKRVSSGVPILLPGTRCTRIYSPSWHRCIDIRRRTTREAFHAARHSRRPELFTAHLHQPGERRTHTLH